MTLGTLFTSLISVADGLGWVARTLTGVCLQLDGLIYSLVSYSFKLFLLMCQLNFNSLQTIIQPLLDRAQAVIIVFIVFKLGIELVNALVKPEEIEKKGGKLIKELFIIGVMLIMYPWVFTVLNEISMLIVGVPDTYEFTVLSSIGVTNEKDAGLISRFVFGKETEVKDIGDFIALETLGMFVRDTSGDGSNISHDELDDTIKDGDGYNFKKLVNILDKVDRKVDYTWGISALMGGYIIYSIVSAAIEIGIRAFKLIVLQILAPVAIISRLNDKKGNIFDNFVSTYIQVYVSAFVRIATMLVMTSFISKFILNIGDFFDSSVGETTGMTRILLTLIIIFSGYKFAKESAKFIDGILKTKMADSKGGFGDFVGKALGFGTGALVGAGVGIASGISEGAGFGGTAWNTIRGAAQGGYNGMKGKDVSDKVKKISSNNEKIRGRSQEYARRGFDNIVLGGMGTAIGLDKIQDAKVRKYDDASKAMDAYDAAVKDAMVRSQEKATDASIAEAGFTDPGHWLATVKSIKFGNDKDAYASQAIEQHAGYASARSTYERIKQDKTASQDDIDRAYSAMMTARQTAKEESELMWETNYAKHASSTDAAVVDARESLVDAMDKAGIEMGTTDSDGLPTGDRQGLVKNKYANGAYSSFHTKATKANITKNKNEFTTQKSYARTHGASKEKKK